MAPNSKLDRTASTSLALVAAVFLIGALLCFINTRRLRDDSAWVAHTQEVLQTDADVLAMLADAESGQRAFIITGDERFLAPFHAAGTSLASRIETLAQLIADNPAQQQRVARLGSVARERLASLARGVALRREQGFDATRDIIAKGYGAGLMNELRTLTEAVGRDERRLLAQRQENAADAYLIAQAATATAALLGVALVLAFTLVLRRNLAAERAATATIDEQREMLRVTLTSIGDGVITTDGEGRVVFLNPVAEQLTGWSLADAAGKPLEATFDIVNEYTRERVVNPVAKVLSEGVIVGLANHTVLIARHGGERPIEDSAAPIRRADGAVAGVVLVFHDASDSREAQSQLRASERELRDANAQLAEADRRKDEFLATLAHELRNPLAPLRNSLELLGRPALDGQARERARAVMLRQVGQMSRLIDELIDVSRISNGKIELQREMLELSTIVDAALEIARPLFEQHGHTYTVELPLMPAYVMMDRTRAAQILSNLLNNAARYTPPNGRIRVHAAADGQWLTIAVQDNGVGIDPALLPHIFEMFVQGERAAVQSHGGLGVGLALARRLVELHGGTLQAHSAGRGKGSEFVVRMPLLPEPTNRIAPAADAPAQLGTETRVLVVDDNREAADVLGALLEHLGAWVRVAYSGAAALAALEEFAATVVLLDIGMPGMDGHQLAALIRARPGGEALTLIAVSGWNQPGDRKRSAEAGIDHHLPKPTDIDSLVSLLASLPEAAKHGARSTTPQGASHGSR